jgi:hypothetical protein
MSAFEDYVSENISDQEILEEIANDRDLLNSLVNIVGERLLRQASAENVGELLDLLIAQATHQVFERVQQEIREKRTDRYA